MMNKVISVTGIEWDTDDQDLALPTDVEIPVSELLDDYEEEDDVDIEDRICDYLSDKYGFCVCCFCMSE